MSEVDAFCAAFPQAYLAFHRRDGRRGGLTNASRAVLTHLAGSGPITVGDDCWLGGGVIVCPGVAIGDRSVIGAGAVVTRDIPADSVAVGNPARVIRTLTRQDETE